MTTNQVRKGNVSQKSKDKKSTQNSIPRDLYEKHKRDHSQKVEAPKSEFQIKFNLHTPFPKSYEA